MIDLNRLIDLLPYYFKENDTYKNAQGKGILERFLEICGSYLDKQVVGNIESLLDNLDVLNCPDHYLGYLWEWFGCIPFAEGEFIDPDKWAQYYNGYDPKDTYDQKKKLWTYPDVKNPIPLDMETKRKILKYAISLLKCRGSKVFFETMFRFYGIKFYTGENNEVQGIIDHVFDLDETIPISTPISDDELNILDGNINMDENYSCTQCIAVEFNILFEDIEGETESEQEERLGRFKVAITNFVNKYLPFNARPIINIYHGGENISKNVYYIRVTDLSTGESQICSSDSINASIWDLFSYDNFQLFFRVETWSTEDPEGRNSHWYMSENIGTTDPDPSKVFPSPSTQVIQKSGANNDNYFFYNYDVIQDSQIDSSIRGLVRITLSLTNLAQNSEVYGLDVEVVSTNGTSITNPLQSIDFDDQTLKIYSYRELNDVKTQVPVSISPNIGVLSKGSDNKGDYFYIKVPQPGVYTITSLEVTSLCRTVTFSGKKVDKVNISFRDQAGAITQSEVIPIDASEIGVWVCIKPTDSKISYDDYKPILENSYIQCINTLEQYPVSEQLLPDGSRELCIYWVTRFTGRFQFRSLFNKDLSDESLWGTLNISREISGSVMSKITPDNYSVNLYNTQDNAGLRTVTFNLKLQPTNYMYSPWKFQSDSSKNGTISIKVYDNAGASSESETLKNNWWGNRISNGILTTAKVERDSDNTAHFTIEVPYVENASTKEPYQGFVELVYNFPQEALVMYPDSPDSSSPVSILAYYQDTSVPVGEAWFAIVPTNPADPQWVNPLPSGESGGVNWDQLYPASPMGNKQHSAIYEKYNETDICSFTIDLKGFSGNRPYELLNDQGGIIESGEFENVNNDPIKLSELGTYVIQFGSDNVEVIVREAPPEINISCTPASTLMESEYDSFTTQVSMSVIPDRPITKQVKVFKVSPDSTVEEDLNTVLDLSTPKSYTINSPGTYIFRSLYDNQSQGTFEAYTVNSIIGGIICYPDQGTLDESVRSTDTIVRIYKKGYNPNGTELSNAQYELVDNKFLIKFPDSTTNLSGTMFTATEYGMYRFTAANNPNIVGTFMVIDNTFEAKFGWIKIEPEDNRIEVTFPYSETLRIPFTAWDSQLLTPGDLFSRPYIELGINQLDVQMVTSEGLRSIEYENLALYVDPDDAHQYNLQVIGITFTEATEIRIKPQEIPSNYPSNYEYDTFYIGAYVPKPDTIQIYWENGTTDNQPTPYPSIPGSGPIIYARIMKEGTTLMTWDEWYASEEKNKVSVTKDGTIQSQVVWSEGEFTKDGQVYVFNPNNASYTFGFKVWATKESSSITCNSSNTLVLKGTVSMKSVTYVMYRNTGDEEWLIDPENNTLEVIDSTVTDRYTISIDICPGYNGVDSSGVNHNMEPQLDIPYRISAVDNGITVEVKKSSGGWYEEVQIPQQEYFTGINSFRFKLGQSYNEGKVYFNIVED